MTTSNYQPDVKVEIAFNAGYATPTASRTWTDVSAYVELDQGISITYGRGDEFTTAEPNHLSLTLDNRDGRFTAGKTGGAYYPNVKIGRPIRVTSTPVGGSASVRFLGYVEEWPLSWDGTDATAYAQITALSRMARLGLNAPLRSVVSEEILSSNPYAYYPLNEPEGSVTAADAVGGPPLRMAGVGGGGFGGTPLAFGAAMRLPGDPGTGLAVFSNTAGNGPYLSGTVSPSLSTAYPFSATIEAFILDSAGATSPNSSAIASIYAAGNGYLILSYGSTGFVAQYQDGVGTTTSVTAGATRSGPVHVAAEMVMTSASAMTLNLYYNGVLAATGGLGTVTPFTFQYSSVSPSGYLDGAELSHVTFGRSATGIQARSDAGLNGFAGESAGARVQRLARYTGVLSNEVDGGTYTQPVVAIDTTGATALDTMRKVEAVEDGVLHDSRSNVLTLFSRQTRFHSSSSFSLTMSQVEADVAPKLDRSTLANDVTATASDGSSQRASDATSIASYGYARQTPDVAGTTEDAGAQAAWTVLRFAEPLSRIPNLGVDLLPLNLATKTLVMAADIGTRFTVSGLPAQAPASSLDFFIEGYTETIGPESYRFVFNVSPVDAPTDLPFWILGDATYGVYDSRPLAY